MKADSIMSIRTKARNKVIFSFPSNGDDFDKEQANNYLTLGQKYTIKTIVVHNFCTDIVLKEVPNITFNSVQFKNVRERK